MTQSNTGFLDRGIVLQLSSHFPQMSQTFNKTSFDSIPFSFAPVNRHWYSTVAWLSLWIHSSKVVKYKPLTMCVQTEAQPTEECWNLIYSTHPIQWLATCLVSLYRGIQWLATCLVSVYRGIQGRPLNITGCTGLSSIGLVTGGRRLLLYRGTDSGLVLGLCLSIDHYAPSLPHSEWREMCIKAEWETGL